MMGVGGFVYDAQRPYLEITEVTWYQGVTSTDGELSVAQLRMTTASGCAHLYAGSRSKAFRLEGRERFKSRYLDEPAGGRVEWHDKFQLDV
jgi:hypothetical protein